MPVTRVRHRFTVKDYDEMIECGILNENHRVELIRGQILERFPNEEKHAGSVNRINWQFNRRVGDLAIVSIQNPIRLSDSEPEPDVALWRLREDSYTSGKAGPEDVLLLVEVSETSLEFDRNPKLPLYAEAGIIEYWIVNLVDDCLEVYRQPQSDGTYRDVQILRRGQQVEPVGLPGVIIDVAELI